MALRAVVSSAPFASVYVIAYTEADDGRRVEQAVGDAFEVRLIEAAVSGYHWRLEASDPSFLEVQEAEAPVPGSAVGGSREVRWHCRTRAPGESTVAWSYGRAWEATHARMFTLRVVVASAL